MKKICIIGASGKLGRYMIGHALDRGYEVVGVCREKSVDKLDEFKDRMTIISGLSSKNVAGNREIIKKAVDGCDGVLTVLVPFGVRHFSMETARAVLECSEKDARLVFSCGWHISRDGKDVYSSKLKFQEKFFGIAKLFGIADVKDQVKACRLVFESDKRWTVVRGSDLEEGESQGLPVWSRHVGDPILASNITRRIDFALFMVAALENDDLIREAPAIVSCKAPSALEPGSKKALKK